MKRTITSLALVLGGLSMGCTPAKAENKPMSYKESIEALCLVIAEHPSPDVQEYLLKPMRRREIILYPMIEPKGEEVWGKSRKGHLQLNPRLATMPLRFQQQVIRHEAKHFRQAAEGQIPPHLWAGAHPSTVEDMEAVVLIELEAHALDNDF